jgi:ribokinase
MTPNETEAQLLTGIRVDSQAAAAKAAGKLHAQGVETVVLTLGARGAYVSAPGCRSFVPGFKVKAVDTTAAGDVFNGALAVALSEDRPLLESVRFASAAAAISVTRLGAQPSAPRRKAIDQFLCPASQER